ncbi:MAG: hypothetical protein HYR94_08375 [Chloroflexi bacterium]|nr:hypothetical protein [Chloroflexota bacterium]
MSLLNRIAYSNGKPQRTVQALRLINEQLEHELDWYSTHAEVKSGHKGLLARLGQTASQPKKNDPTLRHALDEGDYQNLIS